MKLTEALKALDGFHGRNSYLKECVARYKSALARYRSNPGDCEKANKEMSGFVVAGWEMREKWEKSK